MTMVSLYRLHTDAMDKATLQAIAQSVKAGIRVQTPDGAFPSIRGRISGVENMSKTKTERREKTEFEKMMDEITPIINKYGYKNLGFQQTLDQSDLMRFVKDRERIDVIADQMDEEVYEMVMQGIES